MTSKLATGNLCGRKNFPLYPFNIQKLINSYHLLRLVLIIVVSVFDLLVYLDHFYYVMRLVVVVMMVLFDDNDLGRLVVIMVHNNNFIGVATVNHVDDLNAFFAAHFQILKYKSQYQSHRYSSFYILLFVQPHVLDRLRNL